MHIIINQPRDSIRKMKPSRWSSATVNCVSRLSSGKICKSAHMHRCSISQDLSLDVETCSNSGLKVMILKE